MAELLTLYNPNTKRVREALILWKRKVKSTAENVEKILVELDGKRVRLVAKSPWLFSNLDGPASSLYFEIWNRLGVAQLPVANSMWTTSQETVVMRDLTVGGGFFYDKSEAGRIIYRKRSVTTDQIFLQIPREEIEKAATQVLTRASSRNVILAPDDPMSLLVRKDGSFRIYLLDIGLTRFDYPNSEAINQISLIKFMRYIDDLRDRLQGRF